MCACAATAGATCVCAGGGVMVELHAAPSFRLDGKRALVPARGAASGWRPRRRWRTRRACDAAVAHRKGNRGSGGGHPRRGQKADALVLDVMDLAAMQSGDRHGRAVQHPGQQRRHQPAEANGRRHHRGLRRHHGAERARGLFRRAGGGAAADRGQANRLDHQHLVADGPRRRGAPHGLLCQQARDGRLHQGDGDRAGAARHPRELARADLHRDAADQAVLRERGVPQGSAVARSSSAASGRWTNSPARSCISRAMRRG